MSRVFTVGIHLIICLGIFQRTELEAVRERLSHTDHHRLTTEAEEARQQLVALREETENAKKTEVEAGKKLKELEYKVKHAKELKEKEMKASRN